MNRPEHFRARLAVMVTGGALIAALFPMAGSVLAAAPAVTPATGGSAISADTAATSPGNNTYTTSLIGPAISGSGAGDIGAGSLTFTISGAFTFQVGQGSPALSGAGCGTLALGAISVTSSVASVTTTGASTGACSITFSGLKVHPTVGTPLDTTGSIAAGGLATGAAGSLVEVPGAPVLSYQTAPSTSATGGTALAQQPIVLSQDQFGHVRGGDSVSLSSVPTTGGFSCTANPVSTNGSGLASFVGDGCMFTTQGSYVIRASVTGGTSANSATITVATAPATKLVFLTQPGNGIPSAALSPQPVVAIQDNFGNTVTSASATISLTRTGPDLGGPGSLLGCSTAPTVNGVAAFTGCRIDTVGVGYRLTASDVTGGGSPHPYTTATSSKFDVRDRLAFTVQPSGAAAGAVFAIQPDVAVLAGPSNTAVNDSTTSVTLSLSGGPVGAILTCTSNPLTVTAGVASFAGCWIDKIGTYALVASATGFGTTTSTSVTVVAGLATKLGFTAQPNAGTSNQPFTIQPVVAVQDLGGNTVTSGTYSNATITLAIGTNPAGGTLTCTGGLTMVAVAGVAAFSGCQINNAGTGYTLTATATGLTGVTSTAFTVGAPAASITLTTSASVITWAKPVVLTIHFGTSGSLRPFTLQVTRDLVTWSTVPAALTTDTAGNATYSYRPATNLYYRVSYAGASDLSASFSNVPRVVVRQIALLRPTSSGAVTTVSRNTSVTFTTTVRPVRADLAPARVTFVFYRLVGGRWTLSTKRDVLINSLGLAKYTWKFSTSGAWYVRSIVNPTIANANSVWSPVERYNVN
jgi:hypothetical protein